MSIHTRVLRSCGLLPDQTVTKLSGQWQDYFVPVNDSNSNDEAVESGEFGDVRRVKMRTLSADSNSQKLYAIKTFRQGLQKNDRKRLQMILSLNQAYENDAQASGRQQWPESLVRHIGLYKFDTQPRYALLMNDIDGLSLHTMIEQQRRAPLQQWVCWLRDISEGLAFLHRNNIAHRDVHSGNIMISRGGRTAHLVDLELMCAPLLTQLDCRTLCQDIAAAKSTAPDVWCAAQARNAEPLQFFASDIWALASTFVGYMYQQDALLTSRLPYTKRGPNDCVPIKGSIIDKIVQLLLNFVFKRGELRLQPKVQTTLQWMLASDWRDRPTAQQVQSDLLLACATDRDSMKMPQRGKDLQEKLPTADKENQNSQMPVYLE